MNLPICMTDKRTYKYLSLPLVQLNSFILFVPFLSYGTTVARSCHLYVNKRYIIIGGTVVKHLSKNVSLISFIQVTLCIHFSCFLLSYMPMLVTMVACFLLITIDRACWFLLEMHCHCAFNLKVFAPLLRSSHSHVPVYCLHNCIIISCTQYIQRKLVVCVCVYIYI